MGAHKGIPGHYLSPGKCLVQRPLHVQAQEMSFIFDIWCSYIFRGIVIASLSGRVVVTFVSVSKWAGSVGSILCWGNLFFRAAYILFISSKNVTCCTSH